MNNKLLKLSIVVVGLSLFPLTNPVKAQTSRHPNPQPGFSGPFGGPNYRQNPKPNSQPGFSGPFGGPNYRQNPKPNSQPGFSGPFGGPNYRQNPKPDRK